MSIEKRAHYESPFRLEPLDRVNPFVITYLAVKQGFATDLEHCLNAAFMGRPILEGDDEELFDVSGVLWIDVSGVLGIGSLKSLSLAELLDCLSPKDGYPSPILRRYLHHAAELSPEHFSDADPAGLQVAVLSISESCLCRDGPCFDEFVAHFVGQSDTAREYEKKKLLLLSPFLPLLYEAVPSGECAEVLHSRVPTLVRTKGICSGDDLETDAVDFFSSYARFIAMNDPRILHLSDGSCTRYGWATVILPHYELCGVGLRVPKRHGHAADLDPLALSLPRMVSFFEHWGEVPSSYNVDWREVAIKAPLMAKEYLQRTIQGLNVVLYRAIIDSLRREERALRLSDFKRLLGVYEIPLLPFGLLPGRLLAYAPSPRFYNKEAAFYVLRDWVEDQEHRRRRIAKNRIVTPLEPRRFIVDEETIDRVIERNELLSRLGGVLADSIVDDVYREILTEPVSPYYRRQIARNVIHALRRRFRHLGRGIYVATTWEDSAGSQQDKASRYKQFRGMLRSYLAERQKSEGREN
jgi:hypothetical protein